MPISDAFNFRARSCHQQLKRGFWAISLVILAGKLVVGNGWAAHTIQLSGLDYQDGLLSIHATGKANPPAIEVWPGNAGANPTELVILKFPEASGDSLLLQQQGNSLLQTHPELKKCLIGPINAEGKGAKGVQIALEIELPSSLAANSTPVITSNGPDIQIALLPGAPKAMASSVNAANQPSSIAAPSSAKAAPVAQAQALLQGNQRITELEQENTRLKQALSDSKASEDSLRRQLAQYEGYIKEYAPDVDEATHPNEAVIQNLKNALTKLASRLKATEAALAADRNQGLIAPSTTPKAPVEKTPAVSSKPVAALAAPVNPPKPVAANANLMMTVAEPVTNRLTSQRVYQAASLAAKPVNLGDATASPENKVASIQAQEATLEADIRDNPRKYAVYVQLADLYVKRSDLSAAENILTLLLRQNPAYSMGYYKLALVYARQQRKAEAQFALDGYQKLKPNDIQGIQFIQQAIQHGPQTAFPEPIGPANPLQSQAF